MYNKTWAPKTGELLFTRQERTNLFDKFAVAVTKSAGASGVVIGHIPKEISEIVWWFLESGGVVQVEVIDSNRRPSLIPGKGLEIRCSLTFFGTLKRVCKAVAHVDKNLSAYQL